MIRLFYLSSLFIMLAAASLKAQLTGTVDFEYAGVSFTIPSGWQGQETEGGVLLGSNTEAGFILLMQHQASSIDQLKQEADQGLYDEDVALTRSGEYETIGPAGIGAEFSGTIQYERAKAYVIGLINPHGAGLTILSATSAQQYGPRYRELALSVAKSVRFYQPKQSEAANDWKSLLADTRLTYMNTYNSSSYDSYGGYSDKEEIDLCSQGYFKFNSSSTMSFDVPGGFGYSGDKGQGAGTWEVTSDAAGNPVLKLTFHNGQVKEYTLEMRDGKTFLNGYRYFRVGVGDPYGNGPACP